MNLYNVVRFGKLIRVSAKTHITNGSNALCDSNINGLTSIESTIGCQLCNNCLMMCFDRLGGMAAASVELSFYFKQYSGGSNFLDSIHERVKQGLSLSPKQYEASLNTFRSGNFNYSKAQSCLDNLYSNSNKVRHEKKPKRIQ